MRRLQWQVVKAILISSVAGCGFSPGMPGESVTGAGGSISTGAGGVTGEGGGGGIGLSSGAGGDVTMGSGGTSCGQTNVNVMPEPPDILIVQDKSLSMNQDPSGANCNGAGCSKWSQVSAAIENVVMTTETTVNWGLIFFGTDNMCGTTMTPVVPITPATSYNPILNAFTTNQPSSYTPTASAVNNAVRYMQSLPAADTNPKYLLLATDGLPNCGPGGTTADDSTNAVAAVAAAKAAGFPTFVVGIGNTMGDTTLNNMANAGGEPQMGAATSFYSVTDTAGLEAALNTIVGKIASCTIPLGTVNGTLDNVAVSAQDPSGGRVAIMEDPTNGWSFDPTKTIITLNGTACTDLQNGMYTNFQFIYACSGVIICIDSPCP
jgi:hypothetical protein